MHFNYTIYYMCLCFDGRRSSPKINCIPVTEKKLSVDAIIIKSYSVSQIGVRSYGLLLDKYSVISLTTSKEPIPYRFHTTSPNSSESFAVASILPPIPIGDENVISIDANLSDNIFFNKFFIRRLFSTVEYNEALDWDKYISVGKPIFAFSRIAGCSSLLHHSQAYFLFRQTQVITASVTTGTQYSAVS